MNSRYIDYLNQNYSLNSLDHYGQYVQYGKYGKYNHRGGAKNNDLSEDSTDDSTDFPTGGFPPIYLCKGKKTYEELLKEEDEMRKREYTSHQATVKIQDILKKRRNITPFTPV